METFTQSISAVKAETKLIEQKIVAEVPVVEKEIKTVADAIVSWMVEHPKATFAVFFFVLGFIFGTLV